VKRHTRLDCKVPPGKAKRGHVWTCPVCGLKWVETGRDRTSFLGAVLGTERENDGHAATPSESVWAECYCRDPPEDRESSVIVGGSQARRA